MIDIKITSDHIDQSISRLKNMPIYNNSHRKEMANEVGVVGEIVVENYLKSSNVYLVHDDLTTHDYRLKNNKTIDIKTKDRTVIPKDYYECSVPLYNHSHQRPNFYIFVSLLRDKNKRGLERFTNAFIVGAARFVDIEEKSVRWEAGQTDPSNGTTFWTDCLNIRIDQCADLDEIIEIWKTI
jgi:hypothetical protein